MSAPPCLMCELEEVLRDQSRDAEGPSTRTRTTPVPCVKAERERHRNRRKERRVGGDSAFFPVPHQECNRLGSRRNLAGLGAEAG
jgi:hypothetical protein